MGVLPDYYEMLGLTSSATAEEVKRRYRTLARQYHPDMNPNAGAGSKIKEINEAYRILGDAELRSAYDTGLLLAQQQRQSPFQQPPRPKPQAKTAPPKDPPFEYNGFGRAASQAPPQPPTPPKPKTPQRPKSPPRPSLQPLLDEAKLAYVNRNYRQVEELCLQVLNVDSRNVIACEMMGDICVRRAQRERAITYFTYAVQFSPQDRSLQEKLERAMGISSPQSRPIVNRSKGRTSFPQLLNTHHALVVNGASVLAFLLFGGALVGAKTFPGQPALFGFISEYSWAFVVSLVVAGYCGGILLGFWGKLRPLTSEVSEGRALIPLNLIGKWVVGSALLWFYASFIVYIGMGIKRNRFSSSLLTVYGSTFLLVALFTLLYAPIHAASAGVQVTAFSGNLLFPFMLLGWFSADKIRLRPSK